MTPPRNQSYSLPGLASRQLQALLDIPQASPPLLPFEEAVFSFDMYMYTYMHEPMRLTWLSGLRTVKWPTARMTSCSSSSHGTLLQYQSRCDAMWRNSSEIPSRPSVF